MNQRTKMTWHPANLTNVDKDTWRYTKEDKHFWPPEGTVSKDAKLIIDVGCNAGFSTGLLADEWKDARVIGIDMNPHTVERARENLVEFGDRVKIIYATLGYPERKDYVTFTKSSAIDHIKKFSWESGEDKLVQIKSLDTVLHELHIDKEEIDFLKMDIEGAELEILSGPCDWATRTKVFVVEIHSRELTRKNFENMVSRLGFSLLQNQGGQIVGIRS